MVVGAKIAPRENNPNIDLKMKNFHQVTSSPKISSKTSTPHMLRSISCGSWTTSSPISVAPVACCGHTEGFLTLGLAARLGPRRWRRRRALETRDRWNPWESPKPKLFIFWLVVGGSNPFDKYVRQNGNLSSPNFRGEHKKFVKPPPRELEGWKTTNLRCGR